MSPLVARVVGRRRHGVLTVVAIPVDASPAALLSLLPAEEAKLAARFGELRVRTFAAGRIALRAALREAGHRADDAILHTPRGAPLLPAGVRASLSHKNDVAVALAWPAPAAPDDEREHIGVDVEALVAPKSDVSSHVLTPTELAELAHLDAAARARELMLRFSLKESLYKALDPFVQRFVGFLEVEVRPHADGGADFTLMLDKGEGPFVVEGEHALLDEETTVTSVRVRRGR